MDYGRYMNYQNICDRKSLIWLISYLGLISFQLWLSKHPGIFDRKSCEILCFQPEPKLLPLQFQICYRIGNKVFDCFCIPQGIFQYKNGKSLYYLCNCICLLPPSQCEHRSFYIPWICLGIFLKWNKRLIKYLQNGTCKTWLSQGLLLGLFQSFT